MNNKLFDDFNQARRDRFARGRPITEDESMSGWCPQTTATGGLPNLSFIPRKPVPLGTEVKSACCATTGVMVYAELMKGKDAMKVADFAGEFGVNAAIALRVSHGAARRKREADGLAESQASFQFDSPSLLGHSQSGVFPSGFAPQPPGPPAVPRVSGHVVFGDSFFASAAVANAMKRGVAAKDDSLGFSMSFGGPVKLSRRDFPKKYIEDLMEDFPAGTRVVLEGQYKGQVGEANALVAIGYKCNLKKILCFVFTGDCSTRPERPYIARFRDEHGNLATREIPRPACVSQYFEFSPKVDNHNQVRQHELALEKHWIPKSQERGACWSRIWTTFIGITVVDMHKICNAFLCSNHASGLNGLTIKGFADALARALVTNKEDDTRGSVVSAPARASGAKRTVSGTARNAAGERVDDDGKRILSIGGNESFDDDGARLQKNCVVCYRVFGKQTKTTRMVTELNCVPCCDPKTGRRCFEYLQVKGTAPLTKMTERQKVAERRAFASGLRAHAASVNARQDGGQRDD
jgi:hypothetical protein